MYIPNFSDPRVKKRCKRAFSYTIAYTNPRSPRPLSTRDIDLYFGQSQHPLSQWLRKTLLIEHSSFYNWQTGKCKRYLRNSDGCKRLQHCLDPSVPYVQAEQTAITDLVKDWEQQLVSGEFEYKHKSHRHWHPIQNIPSEHRKRELSRYGYSHIYDIRCAAPSIILWLAQSLGINHKHTQTIQHYIEHRAEMRQSLSRDLGISGDDAKKLITMLFAGAPVGHIGNLATTELLKGDSRTIELVKQHPYVQHLRQNISRCWNLIGSSELDGEYLIPRTYHADGRKKRITSRDRWNLYFFYENAVMKSVTDYLDKNLARYFIEHDGWSCDVRVDLIELTDQVRCVTGINTIEFEYEYYQKEIT